MKVRTLIVDDERPARVRVRSMLAPEKDVEIVGEASNGSEALTQILELRPALLFLDIEMPPPGGLEVLRTVRTEWLPCTIFTTAHSEHAVEAFAVHALDYLLKPYSAERFKTALERARVQIGLTQGGPDLRLGAFLESTKSTSPIERFLVKTNETYVVVRAAEIEWVEAASNYVVLHVPGGRHVLRKTLATLESELDPKRFFRVSRSAVVNFDHVKEVQQGGNGDHVIQLRNGDRVALTRGLREFQDRFQAGM